LEDVDGSILDCAKREVLEETGQHIIVGYLRYIREFIDSTNDTRHLELFYQANLTGNIGVKYAELAPTLYDNMILDVKWLGQDEMSDLAVFPEILKNEYRKEKKGASPLYLGVTIESDDRKT
jgi:8-oxo-dGTP pyrophosphatase MutT (NUDIX family)